VKRVRGVLLSILLCSCVGHGEGGVGEGGNPAESGGLPFLDRSNPLVEHTFEVMEVRAHYSYLRELHRSNGGRVCEEGENQTTWKQDCNTCRCEWGVRSCTKAGCHSPETSVRLRAEAKRDAREKAERYRELREMHRARGVRVCEEGEDGTIWKEGCNTCWCESGLRSCTTGCAEPPSFWEPPPPVPTEDDDDDDDTSNIGWNPAVDYREIYPSISRRLCEGETSWKESCLTCWCEGGFVVCSKADCPSSYHPKGTAATDGTE
jgi:hypothetical protein